MFYPTVVISIMFTTLNSFPKHFINQTIDEPPSASGDWIFAYRDERIFFREAQWTNRLLVLISTETWSGTRTYDPLLQEISHSSISLIKKARSGRKRITETICPLLDFQPESVPLSDELFRCYNHLPEMKRYKPFAILSPFSWKGFKWCTLLTSSILNLRLRSSMPRAL